MFLRSEAIVRTRWLDAPLRYGGAHRTAQLWQVQPLHRGRRRLSLSCLSGTIVLPSFLFETR